jgi:CBS domain-containing protein
VFDHRDVLAVEASMDALTALTVMRTNQVRHLPVVRAGRCVGLVTETDLLRALTVSATIPPLAVGTLCRRTPVLPPDPTLPAAAAAILASGVDAALVVRDGVPRGILTGSDIPAVVAGDETGGATAG